nr:ribonuclease H-like domain-containing protein [Tanacetum cinerariifolium]
MDKKDIMLVQVYVDDIIFSSTKKSWCDEFEALMKNSRDKYVAEILKKFDFLNAKTASTPIETKKPLVNDEDDVDVDVHLYRSMIGSLMYLTTSRPDIIESAFDLEAYSDCDYAGANLDKKSITGGCQFLGRRLISWQCKKQTIVATSTTEAEHHFIRDAYEKKLIQVLKIHTDDNVDDLLTKAFDVSRKGLKFSGKITPLFLNMLIQAEGEGSRAPIEPQPTPYPTHPSTGDQPLVTESSSSHDTTQDSRDSLKGTNRSKGDQVQSSHDSPLSGGHTSDRAEGALNLEELFSICTNLSNRVLALETVKDAQAAEIIALKARIKKKKESISKHGRKKDKPEPTLDDSTLDDLDADHGMDIEEPINQGRLSKETKELVSTVRLGDSTVRPDVGTADPIVPPPTATNIKDSSSRPARSILNLKILPTIDPKDKGKVVLEEPEPAKKMTRSDLDASQIAKDVEIARLVYEEELAKLEREKKKRQREEEAFKANMGGYKYSQLKAKTFVEIQGLYERQKRVIDDFKPTDLDDAVDKEKVLEETDNTKFEESKFYHLDRHGVECIYYRIFRFDGSSRWIKTFFEMVTRFDRMDLEELYNLVMQRFETNSPEGVDLVLWGDLRTIFEETTDDDLWKNQKEWILKSWNFYENYGVHTLTLEDGTEIYMLAERRFIQKQIDESGSHDGSENDLLMYKARLVANGSNQRQGIGCDETFSPVVKPATIRAVLSLVVSSSSSAFLQWIIASLHNEFAMKDLEENLEQAHMQNCNPCWTPVDTESKLGSDGDPINDPTLYRSLAGALYTYTDDDWAGCPVTRRSTSGYCMFLGDNLLSWYAKRQVTLSRSSAEVDYRGVANVVAETTWIRNLLCELYTPLFTATLVYCDNVSVVYMSANPFQHQRTKHIEIDIHFVRDVVAIGQVRVLHVPLRFQYADIFMKGLPTALFLEFCSSLNIRRPPAQTAKKY